MRRLVEAFPARGYRARRHSAVTTTLDALGDMSSPRQSDCPVSAGLHSKSRFLKLGGEGNRTAYIRHAVIKDIVIRVAARQCGDRADAPPICQLITCR